jgi:hypothetical protein
VNYAGWRDDVVTRGDAALAAIERFEKSVAGQAFAVVVDLQGADAWGDIENAGQIFGAQLGFERVRAETKVEIEDVGAVFHQQVAVAIGAADDGGRGCGRGLRAQHGVYAAGGAEPDQIAGLQLAHLPKFRCDDCRGTHEAAEAGAVGA